MQKVPLLLILLLSICKFAFTQGCPSNIDFEQGNFNHWNCFTGSTFIEGDKNIIDLIPSQPLSSRHEIMSSTTGKDPYGNFPTLCPYGSKYSVKLGNDNTGKQAEGLSYTFQVPATEDTFSFTYFYAVVFQDPDHPEIEQPRFFVTAYDSATGNLINCASYNYIATSSLPGFEVSTKDKSVLFKNWSPVSIQFAGLANKTVRLEFKTADCTKGAHFGYAYLDVGAGCSNILATAPYCIETNSVILNAPYGFKNYTWYNNDYSKIIGSMQSLTLSPPPATDKIFHVDMEPYEGFGCRDTVDAVVTPLPVPDTPLVKESAYCQYDYSSPMIATGDPGNEIWWYKTETGGIGSSETPTPSTASPGEYEYYVSQKVLFGCESFRRKVKVTIAPTPKGSLILNGNIKQCQDNNTFDFTNTSTNLNSSSYVWDWGDGTTSSQKDDTHTYKKEGSYSVKMTVTNPPSCTSETYKQIVVVPKPVADFSFPPVICENQTMIVLTDKSYVPGSLSQISKWRWDINGKIATMQNPFSFTSDAGQIPVNLLVESSEGCISDTNKNFIRVRYIPEAAFKYKSNLFCDNEIVYFTSLASMPSQAIDEKVAKWNWEFDNTVISTDKDPSLVFSSGLKHAKLIVESNYGCISNVADSTLNIYPKPEIRLDINDSCVFRNINYNAVDVTGSVNKWFWNFGNGLHEDVSFITKSYLVEGYNPLTLIGQTIHGCKDTILRSFTIYDNKAFAGRDTLAAFTQPIYLNAHGGPHVNYIWTPATGLSNPFIENPIALLDHDQLYKLDAMSDKGCDAHSQIFIKRWKGPALYIPTAFTPNSDGLNEKLSVFPVGIKQFIFFAVYNRLGQQIFYTTDFSKSWDGTFNRAKCDAGNYVAVAKAIDYTGQTMLQKVNVILMR